MDTQTILSTVYTTHRYAPPTHLMKGTAWSVLSVTPGIIHYHIVCLQVTQYAVNGSRTPPTVDCVDQLGLLSVLDKMEGTSVRVSV